MSHLTTYNSNVLINVKKSILRKALKELNLEIDYNIKTVKNSYINEKVDAGFVKNGKAISIGARFVQEGKNTKFQVAGDFFCTGINESGFIDKLSQIYKKYDVIEQCKNQGWIVDKEDIHVDQKTNEIVIQASRYAS